MHRIYQLGTWLFAASLLGCGASTPPAPAPAATPSEQGDLVAVEPAAEIEEPATETEASDQEVVPGCDDPSYGCPGDEGYEVRTREVPLGFTPEMPVDAPVDASLPAVERLAIHIRRSRHADAAVRSAAIAQASDIVGTLSEDDCLELSEADIRLLLSYRDHRPLRQCLRDAGPDCQQLDASEIEPAESYAPQSDDGQARAYAADHRTVVVFGNRAIRCDYTKNTITHLRHYAWGSRALAVVTTQESDNYDCGRNGEQVRCTEQVECTTLATRGGRLLLAGCEFEPTNEMVLPDFESPFHGPIVGSVQVVDDDTIMVGQRRLRMVHGVLVPAP